MLLVLDGGDDLRAVHALAVGLLPRHKRLHERLHAAHAAREHVGDALEPAVALGRGRLTNKLGEARAVGLHLP